MVRKVRPASDPVTGCSVHWRPQNQGQRDAQRYYPAADVMFLLGPAGVGKTLAAVGMAASEVVAKTKDRVVALSPGVECGNSVGFLQGTLLEKISPWGVPFRQNLAKVSFGKLPPETVTFDALGFIRGVTYENSVVILDEAQNASLIQLRLFLTRIGRNTKLVILGDPEQSDVRPTQAEAPTDLEFVVGRLEGVRGVAVVEFDPKETLRHPLIGKMLEALR